jgi:hypothetical protein
MLDILNVRIPCILEFLRKGWRHGPVFRAVSGAGCQTLDVGYQIDFRASLRRSSTCGESRRTFTSQLSAHSQTTILRVIKFRESTEAISPYGLRVLVRVHQNGFMQTKNRHESGRLAPGIPWVGGAEGGKTRPKVDLIEFVFEVRNRQQAAVDTCRSILAATAIQVHSTLLHLSALAGGRPVGRRPCGRARTWRAHLSTTRSECQV